MTKLLEYFELASGDDNSFRELSPDAVAGTVINTLDRNIVFRIEVSSKHNLIACVSTSCLHITVEQSEANSKLDLGAKVVSQSRL